MTSPGRSSASHCGSSGVDLRKSAGESLDVVAVPPDLIEVDQVGEEQAVLHLLQVRVQAAMPAVLSVV